MEKVTTTMPISASGTPDRFKILRLALRQSKVARAVMIKIDGAVGVPVNNLLGQSVKARWSWTEMPSAEAVSMIARGRNQSPYALRPRAKSHAAVSAPSRQGQEAIT
jgi:hypothetical protein